VATYFSDDVIRARRARLERVLDIGSAILVVGAGSPIGVPGGHDQTHPWRAHPEYAWLTGENRPGSVIAWSVGTGWVHFVEPLSAGERLWEGVESVPEGEPLSELFAWLNGTGAPALAVLGCRVLGAIADARATAVAQEALNTSRRPKDEEELTLIRRAVSATAAGHANARELIRTGVSERAIQIELEAEFFRHGADSTGYGTIVGAGRRAAILHGHPSSAQVKPGELVLIDAGASIDGYSADVTRTWGCGALAGRAVAVHRIVTAALDAGIAASVAGTEWHDVHRVCATVIAQGLVDEGVMRGSIDWLTRSGAVSLFFPHGVGHLLGAGVRDVGGHAPDRPANRECCGARVRVDLPLQAGFVMTVEPGLYFVDALLDDPERRERYADAVDWSALDAWRGLGGVRMEDDILIKESGAPENLTAMIPR
jgi:Xaa-Pro aminopeptidase